MALQDKLVVELFIDDGKAQAVLVKNKEALRRFQSDVGNFRPQFGKGITGQLDEVRAGFAGVREIIAGTAVVATIGFGATIVKAVANAGDATRQLKANALEAGLAFEKATESAVKFAERAGLAQAEANRTFSGVINFARGSGRIDQLDLFTKRLTDLAGAKGIKPEQLGDISRQLNALTDEATDKLLGANPSAFYDAYAKSIGTTAEKLTDLQKRQAVFDEVIRRGAIFDGEAEKRLGDVSGKLDTVSARFENLKTKIGEFASPLIKNSLDLILSIGNPNLFRSDQDRSEAFAKARAEAEKRAKEQADALRASDAEIRNAQANPRANFRSFALSRVNIATGFFNIADRQNAIKQATDEAQKFVNDLQGAIDRALSSKAPASILRLARADFLRNQTLFDGETRARIANQITEALSSSLAKGYADALADPRSNLATLRKKLGEIVGSTEITADTKRQLAGDFERTIGERVREGKARVEEIQKQILDLTDALGARRGENNPFVAVFSEAEKSMRALREQTRFLSEDLRNTLETLERNQNKVALFNVRADAGLQALDLREQASALRSFQSGSPAIADREAFFKAFLENEVKALGANTTGFARESTFGTFLRFNLAENAGLSFDRLATGGTIRRARTFEDLTDAERQRFLETSGAVADNSSLQARLSAQLALVNRLAGQSGLGVEQAQALADRRIIGLTAGIRPDQLNDSLRDALAGAREREAVRLETAEREAGRQREEQIALNRRIAGDLEKLVKIAQDEGIQGVIRIVDETKGKIETSLGKRPRPDDARALFE